jgi:hypothetical protein
MLKLNELLNREDHMNKYFFLIVFLAFSCKKQPTSHQSHLKHSGENSVNITGSEFDDLYFDLDILYLGLIKTDAKDSDFLSSAELSKLKSEFKLALDNRSNNLQFLYCDHRSFWSRTTENKECDYIVDLKETSIYFTFRSLNKDTLENCMLIDSGCEIFQIYEFQAKNNGSQRPAVFAKKTPISKRAIVMTSGVFFPVEEGLKDFWNKMRVQHKTAGLIMNPYNIHPQMGRDLAGLLNECGRQYMNIVNFAQGAKKRYWDFNKPLLITKTAAISMLHSAFLVMGIRAPTNLITTVSKLKATGKLKTMKGLLAGLNAIDDLAMIPLVVSELSMWRENLNKYPVDSPQRKVMEVGLVLAKIGDIAGISNLSIIAAKHWRTTAKVLSVLAVGTGASVAAIKLKYKDQLTSSLKNGDNASLQHTLCLMEKEAGIKDHCPSVNQVKPVSVCGN